MSPLLLLSFAVQCSMWAMGRRARIPFRLEKYCLKLSRDFIGIWANARTHSHATTTAWSRSAITCATIWFEWCGQYSAICPHINKHIFIIMRSDKTHIYNTAWCTAERRCAARPPISCAHYIHIKCPDGKLVANANEDTTWRPLNKIWILSSCIR